MFFLTVLAFWGLSSSPPKKEKKILTNTYLGANKTLLKTENQAQV